MVRETHERGFWGNVLIRVTVVLVVDGETVRALVGIIDGAGGFSDTDSGFETGHSCLALALMVVELLAQGDEIGVKIFLFDILPV